MKPLEYIVLLASLLLCFMFLNDAKAGGYFELGAGYNVNLTGCTACWDDAGAGPLGAYLRVGGDLWEHEQLTAGVHWIHLSQWLKGPPFNQEAESSVDHVGMYIRYEFR